ncbi:hypothetical protein NDU88_005716 [Pleurodeles waltl]|uniref:Uncharacterized protein n=1 Tax=Pleurodeles waltl TaxID=8319 RepID=A0AAV7UIT4_PLEWA|nr:hypothetical protein NDU88_005716 [Pleurodeles waltl]
MHTLGARQFAELRRGNAKDPTTIFRSACPPPGASRSAAAQCVRFVCTLHFIAHGSTSGQRFPVDYFSWPCTARIWSRVLPVPHSRCSQQLRQSPVQAGTHGGPLPTAAPALTSILASGRSPGCSAWISRSIQPLGRGRLLQSRSRAGGPVRPSCCCTLPAPPGVILGRVGRRVPCPVSAPQASRRWEHDPSVLEAALPTR